MINFDQSASQKTSKPFHKISRNKNINKNKYLKGGGGIISYNGKQQQQKHNE